MIDDASRPIQVRPYKEPRTVSPRIYDYVVASLGYESRSVYISQQIVSQTRRLLAYSFHDNRLLKYEENRLWFSQRGKVVDVDASDFRSHLVASIEDHLRRREAVGETGIARICVDISSMTRERLAQTILALFSDVSTPLEVDFLYAPAAYMPDLGTNGPVTVSRPLLGFEGWARDPATSTTCILGLGFESSLALGVLEYLDPTSVWAFAPFGRDPRYDAEMLSRNTEIRRELAGNRILSYDVASPFQMYLKLESLSYGLNPQDRQVVVPLGPKIFALASLLLGYTYQEQVTVWRVSAGSQRGPIDVTAQGIIVGLTVNSFERSTIRVDTQAFSENYL